jgi:hypothetical protein
VVQSPLYRPPEYQEHPPESQEWYRVVQSPLTAPLSTKTMIGDDKLVGVHLLEFCCDVMNFLRPTDTRPIERLLEARSHIQPVAV